METHTLPNLHRLKTEIDPEIPSSLTMKLAFLDLHLLKKERTMIVYRLTDALLAIVSIIGLISRKFNLFGESLPRDKVVIDSQVRCMPLYGSIGPGVFVGVLITCQEEFGSG